jgi:hypothetical protein
LGTGLFVPGFGAAIGAAGRTVAGGFAALEPGGLGAVVPRALDPTPAPTASSRNAASNPMRAAA